jgi:hypothetical protein
VEGEAGSTQVNRGSSISDIALGGLGRYTESEGTGMTSQVLEFVELSENDRRAMSELPALRDVDRVTAHLSGDGDQSVTLPPQLVALVGSLLTRLRQGERIAILSDEEEISPQEASTILGLSRPLVVHRMNIGDLPFRYVGTHRRTRLKDVLALKEKLDLTQAAVDDLAEETESLINDYGL